MAKLSDLIEAMAEATRLRPQSVNLCARHLREAGLIRQHGRGRHGAEMGGSDAVNLLLGLMASDALQDAPQAVRAARACGFDGSEWNYDGRAVDDVPPFLFMRDEAGKARSFGDAMDALLAEIIEFGDPLKIDETPIKNFRVIVSRPGLQATIEVTGAPTVFMHFKHESLRLEGLEGEALFERTAEIYAGGLGMGTETSVGMEALWHLARCIGDRPEEGDG